MRALLDQYPSILSELKVSHTSEPFKSAAIGKCRDAFALLENGESNSGSAE